MAGYRIGGGAPAGMKAILQPDGSIFQTGFRGLAKDRTPLRTDRSALMRCLPRFSKITSFAKCASTHCARRRSAARLRSGGSGLRAARFVGLVRCRQSPDTSTPVAPRPDYRPRTRAQNCRCYRAGRAPRRSNGNGRRTAVLSSCRSRRRRPVVRRAHSIPSRKVHIFACANLLHCWRAFVVDRPCPRHIAFVCARSKALLAIRKFHRRRSATERRAKAPRSTRGGSATRHAGRRRHLPGSQRGEAVKLRASTELAPMPDDAESRTGIWRIARENQKARAAGAGGRSTSNRISPSKRSFDSCQAML